MPHPRLQNFFTGAVDELHGAYRKSEGAPTACVGSLRERGVRRAIEHSLPSIVRLYDGEVIDPGGGHSGQLDGILVHATGSALATAHDDSRVALAEGVLAVIESKSSLTAQWGQVHAMWDKLKTLRKFVDEPKGIFNGAPPAPFERAIPLAIIGREGWKRQEMLEAKVQELVDSFGAPECPPIIVVQLDPPGVCVFSWEDDTGPRVMSAIFDKEERWKTLSHLWSMLGEIAERVIIIPVDWTSYLW